MFGRGIFLFFLRKKLFLICKMETGEYIKALCSRLNAGVVDVEMCSGGGIGRRVWLRSIWSNPWGFKSPPEYHDNNVLRDSRCKAMRTAGGNPSPLLLGKVFVRMPT